MSDTKSKVDSFFDIIDTGMDKLESVIRPAEADRNPEQKQLAASEDWARVERAVYHKFPDDGFEAACTRTFAPADVDKRGPLVKGTVVSACTTCMGAK